MKNSGLWLLEKIKVKYTICIKTAFLSDVHVCILNFLYQLEAALSINV